MNMADLPIDDIQKRLAGHSAYFSSLIELIPVKHYLPVDYEETSSKFFKNRGKIAPKQAIKEASRRAKRTRLDPSLQKSVQELQADKDKNTGTSSLNEQERNDSEISEGDFSVEKVGSRSLDDLRSRLQARIQDFQRKRSASNCTQLSQRPPKKSKTKAKEIKRNKEDAQRIKDSRNLLKQDELSSSKQVLNEKGEVVFSKFDFVNSQKPLRPGTKAKNYSKLLLKAEARKKKLEALQSEDPEKAKEVQEKLSWKHAMEKAEGLKQTDDPKLLKKSIKKKEKQKSKSRKQWKERIDHQKSQAEERQRLRQKNIKERIEAKKGKNKSKGKKRHKPGF